MRWVVGDRAITGCAASASQMGRFETEWLTRPENLAAFTDLPGRWIDKVHTRRPPRTIVLDMDSSESPTYGAQEGSAYNGHFGCTCYHSLFVFNQLGDLGSVEIHRELMTAATRWIMAWKLWSVLSARMAMRLNSLSLQQKFSIRWRHLYISVSICSGGVRRGC